MDAALAPGASVAGVARANGLNANLVFKWIRRSREGWRDRRRGQRACLQDRAVVIVDEPDVCSGPSHSNPKGSGGVAGAGEESAPRARRDRTQGARRGAMEIRLPNGARVASKRTSTAMRCISCFRR